MTLHAEVGRIAAAGDPNVRVLHPLRLHEGPTGVGVGRGLHVGVAIDVETTGLDVDTGKVPGISTAAFWAIFCCRPASTTAAIAHRRTWMRSSRCCVTKTSTVEPR